MYHEVFGELTYDYDYIAKKEITFFENTHEVEVYIRVEEDEEISQVQIDSFKALMENWDEMQHKIAAAILKYYNEEEKYSYGPGDYGDEEYEEDEEDAEWWPDIDSEEELVKKIHLDSIIIKEEFLMDMFGKNPIYVLFDRDWGGEDWDDNGVAVLIEDGEVSKVAYKDIAF